MEVKFVPLTFISESEKISEQIRNTIIFQYALKKYRNSVHLENLLSNTRYGYTASAKKEGKFKLVRITDIQHGRINWEKVPFCECDKPEDYFLEEGDILVARTGGTVGKTFLINEKVKNAVFASYLIRLRADKYKILPKYLFYFLNSYLYWSQIIDLKSGSAQPNVNAEKLKSLFMPYCDIKMQQEIVNLIEKDNITNKNLLGIRDILKKITKDFFSMEELNKINLYLPNYISKLRQQILQEAIQGKLVPQNPKDEPASELLKKIRAEKEKLIKEGKIKKQKPLPPISEDEIPYELPKGWAWCRLGEICEYIQRGKSPRYSNIEKYPVIAQKCIQWSGFEMFKAKFIDPNTIINYDEERFIKTNDLLWNSTGVGTLGRIIIYDEKFNRYDKAVADSHVTVIRPIKKLILSKYIFSWFAGPKVQNEINDISTGSTKQTELATSTIIEYLVPLPPLSEQKRIVEKVDKLMIYCDELEKQIKENQVNSEKLMSAVLKESFEHG